MLNVRLEYAVKTGSKHRNIDGETHITQARPPIASR